MRSSMRDSRRHKVTDLRPQGYDGRAARKDPLNAKNSLCSLGARAGRGHLLKSQGTVEMVLNVLDTVAQ
jgi:hypothetical protein